ncbi:MAG: sulfotransferase [Candidatus Omnitrophota bacterium]
MLNRKEKNVQTLDTCDKYLDSPVFICGHRKTGTTMLVNLFDGSNEAVVYPDDSGFFYLYYPRYEASRYSNAQKTERLANAIIADNLKTVIEEARCPEACKAMLKEKNQRYYDLFSQYTGEGDVKDILKYFIKCFRDVYYPDMGQPKVWIEKTTSTEIYALELSKIFPRARFIHLIRDPRDNWASLKSGWDKRYKNFNDDIKRLKQSLLERGKLGMEMAKYNVSTIGSERYKVIRFEDFTQDAQAHMKDLCSFIDISFNESMLTPSTFGYFWEGNNFDGKKFKKTSSVNVNRWAERIEAEDAQLIEFHFRDIMNYFGYQCEFSIEQSQRAAAEHYKWFNFSTPYSAK